MDNEFVSRATSRRQRLADKETDLCDVTEFIAPDGLFKTTNAKAPKKHGYSVRYPSGGLGEDRTF